jgi:TATA-binding protein-associated factor
MSRLDRLVTILETGSTPFVRNTAADQLADLAKQHPHDILNLISRVYPFLFHKKWETRISAAKAFGGIISHIPQWDPNSNDTDLMNNQISDISNLIDNYTDIKKEEDLDFDEKLNKMLNTDEYESMLVSFKDWNLNDILSSDCVLLSTTDDSFNMFKSLDNKLDSTLESNKKIKLINFTKKIGFDDLISGLKSELKSESSILNDSFNDTIVKTETSKESSKVSARMRALAKRKAKLGTSKPIPVDISQSSISNQLSKSNDFLNSNSISASSPDSNTDVNNIDITTQQNGTKLIIENKPLQETVSSFAKFVDHVWILQGVYELLIKSLFSPNWEIRHGSTLGLREIIKFKSQAYSVGRVSGKTKAENDERNNKTLEDLVVRILAVLSMDRFGDYVSDTVVAPVRENAAQVLAAVLRWINDSNIDFVFDALCNLVKQENIEKSCWEAKHGGLLGLRYFVSIKPDLLLNNNNMLLDTANIVLNCLRGNPNDIDRDDDVQTVAASILLPITKQFVTLQKDLLKELLSVLWGCLVDLKDDLAAATGSVMDLLGSLCSEEVVSNVLHEMSVSSDDWNFSRLVPRLYPFLRHSLTGVRRSVLKTLLSFIDISDESMHDWIDGHIIRLIFQNLLLERNEEVLDLSAKVYDQLINHLIKNNLPIDEIIQNHIVPLIDLMITPIGLPRFNYSMNPANILRSSGQSISISDIQLTGINYKKVLSNTDINKAYHESNSDKKKKRKHGENNNDGDTSFDVNNSSSISGIPKSEYDLQVNIDAPMINCDVTLVPLETIYRTRLISASAMGRTLSKFQNEDILLNVFSLLKKNIKSNFLTSRMVSSWILNEFFSYIIKEGKVEKVNYSHISEFINPTLLELLTLPVSSLPFFKEIVPLLRNTRSHCSYLMNLFREQAHLSSSKLKVLAVLVSGENDAGPGAFSLNDAKDLVGNWYENSYKSLSATSRISFGKSLENARDRIQNSIIEVDDEFNSRLNSVFSSIAGTYIHSVVFEKDGTLPNKLNPIIRSLMDGVKLTNSSLIQDYTSKDVAYLVDRLIDENRNAIAEKIVKNLCGFLCVDPAEVPEYIPNKNHDGILSLYREGRDANMVDDVPVIPNKDSENVLVDFEVKGAIIKRRGGKVTLETLVELFGSELFNKLPKLKLSMIEPLTYLNKNIDEITDKEGQNVIDCYELIKTLFPCIDIKLRDDILNNIDNIIEGLSSSQSVFRYSASKCIASIISTVPTIGFQFLVEKILPMLNNPLQVNQRQGSVECIYHVVQLMESNILPYIVFLIVPILGRMSDSNKDVRLISTATFAQIIKLVPLESGIPDPVDMPQSLLEGRQKEREFLSQMMDPTKIEPFELPVSIKATLRKYQQEGVNWLYFLNKYHLHGILCDDMGLGKTLQTICMVSSDHYLRAKRFTKDGSVENRRLPSLIVCPPSLTGHWEQEFQQYAEFMKVLVYAGPPSVRSQLKIQIENEIKDNIDVIVTSYDIVRNDIEFISNFDFNYCVLDEGHIIKNAKSVLSKCVKRLKADHRLLLSGTPIQNNVVELWSLFDFLMPGFLGTYKQFDNKFAKPIALSRKNKGKKEQERGALVLESLHKQVLPFMLRRLKEDVLADLPPKIIQDYYCDLSNLQKQLYRDFITKQKKNIVKDIEETAMDDNSNNFDDNADDNKNKNAKQHVFQVLQYMRKLCNHPSLVLTPNHPQYEEVTRYLKKSHMNLEDIEHAPKLLALKNLLKECGIGLIGNESTVISQHRALIFCQMKDMLDIVENDLIKKNMPNVTYLRMDGSTDPRYRQNIVKKFNDDPSIDVLLLTTKVGGLGLNLTGADTVIFVEHDWNPMNDLQAMDRAHRLGQKRVVNVYRLITKNTLEEKIMGLQKFKMNIASTIVNQQNSGLASMDTHQLLDLFDSDKVSNDEENKDNNTNNNNNNNNNINISNNGKSKIDNMDDVTEDGGLGGKAGTVVKELGELWDAKQYEEEYNLNSFINTLK